MLTPVVLSFTSSFWQALVAEAARSSVHGVLECVKAHIPGRQASSFIVYQLIYLATPRGPALVSLMRRCEAPAVAARSKGLFAYASALQQANVCYLGAERTEAWWGLLGVGVLVAAAGAIFLAQPWWYRRRGHLSELTGDGAAELITRLEGCASGPGQGRSCGCSSRSTSGCRRSRSAAPRRR
jgi:hypothetical protein